MNIDSAVQKKESRLISIKTGAEQVHHTPTQPPSPFVKVPKEGRPSFVHRQLLSPDSATPALCLLHHEKSVWRPESPPGNNGKRHSMSKNLHSPLSPLSPKKELESITNRSSRHTSSPNITEFSTEVVKARRRAGSTVSLSKNSADESIPNNTQELEVRSRKRAGSVTALKNSLQKIALDGNGKSNWLV